MSLKIFFLFVCSIVPLSTHAFFWHRPQQKYTVIIDPAGDAQNTGRSLSVGYERSVTLHIAQEIQRYLVRTSPHITVVLTRQAGQVITPLQNAQFANRIPAHLFIRVHAFEEKNHTVPSLTVYRYRHEDEFPLSPNILSFTPYEHAYRYALEKTRAYAQIFDTLAQQNSSIYYYGGLHALPLVALVGIQVPAFVIDIGITDQQSIPQIATFIAENIRTLFSQQGMNL